MDNKTFQECYREFVNQNANEFRYFQNNSSDLAVCVHHVREFCKWLRNEKQVKLVDMPSIAEGYIGNDNMSLFLSDQRPAEGFVLKMIERIYRILLPHQDENAEQVPPPLNEQEQQQYIQENEENIRQRDIELTPRISNFIERVQQLTNSFKQRYATVEGIDTLRPVICGHRDRGGAFDLDLVRIIQLVTIYDSPSGKALLSGCAGYGESAINDCALAAKFERCSIFAEGSCVIEAIKTPCSSTFNVDYTEEEEERWSELLVEQLELFPSLAQIRVLCTKKRALKLFSKLGINRPKKGIVMNCTNGRIARRIPIVWFSHPSPINVRIFNVENVVNERRLYLDYVANVPFNIETARQDLNTFITTCNGIPRINVRFERRPRNFQVNGNITNIGRRLPNLQEVINEIQNFRNIQTTNVLQQENESTNNTDTTAVENVVRSAVELFRSSGFFFPQGFEGFTSSNVSGYLNCIECIIQTEIPQAFYENTEQNQNDTLSSLARHLNRNIVILNENDSARLFPCDGEGVGPDIILGFTANCVVPLWRNEVEATMPGGYGHKKVEHDNVDELHQQVDIWCNTFRDLVKIISIVPGNTNTIYIHFQRNN